MSNPQTSTLAESSDGLTPGESNLGKALALIHRVLPILRQPERASDVQNALRHAAAMIEAARLSLAGNTAASTATAGSVEPEMVAVIAAAIATMLDRPHRLVSVVPVEIFVPHLNVWAFEGRSQLFVSHKVR